MVRHRVKKTAKYDSFKILADDWLAGENKLALYIFYWNIYEIGERYSMYACI